MSTTKYLSDRIYVTIPAQTAGRYLTYQVKDTNNSDKIIFTGRLFTTGEDQIIYLNDILASYAYKYDYIGQVNVRSTAGIYMTIVVSISEIGYSSTPQNVLNMYRKVTDPIREVIDLDNTASPIYNVLNQNTSLLPRIPRGTFNDDKDSFWFNATLLFPKNYTGTTIDINFMDRDETGGNLIYRANIKDHVALVMVDSSELNTIQPYFKYIAMNDDKLAVIEDCNAEYYLMWVDRSGAYQCQPFERKCYHNEEVDTKNIVNLLDEERPYEKIVTNKWELNSDWISFEDQSTYESILVSPYLYLYNAKTDIGLYVNCTDSQWEEYSESNRNRPFKFTVNLQASEKQNILY